MFAEMWFLVGISRVVLSSSIFLRGLVVDAHSSFTSSSSSLPHPSPSSLYLCQSLPPSSTSIYFHFLNVAICSVTPARLGWEAVWRFHRTWSCSRWCEVTGQRWGGGSRRGSSVTSGKRAGPLAALLAPGVPGMYRRRSPWERALNQCHLLKVTSYF